MFFSGLNTPKRKGCLNGCRINWTRRLRRVRSRLVTINKFTRVYQATIDPPSTWGGIMGALTRPAGAILKASAGPTWHLDLFNWWVRGRPPTPTGLTLTTGCHVISKQTSCRPQLLNWNVLIVRQASTLLNSNPENLTDLFVVSVRFPGFICWEFCGFRNSFNFNKK